MEPTCDSFRADGSHIHSFFNEAQKNHLTISQSLTIYELVQNNIIYDSLEKRCNQMHQMNLGRFYRPVIETNYSVKRSDVTR